MSISSILSNLRTQNKRVALLNFRIGTCTSGFEDLMQSCKDNKDFQKHDLVAIGADRNYENLFGAFVHAVNRGPSQGGLRYWNGYKDLDEFLSDGLRLSEGMSRKSALAGIWWGGGKGIICGNNKKNTSGNNRYPHDSKERTQLFEDYGSFLGNVKGTYVTAEDVGTTTADMDAVFQTTRYVTCISHDLGGSGNPSTATAQGVIAGIETLNSKINESTFAIQGFGNVSQPMVDMLLERGAQKIYVCDVDFEKVQHVDKRVVPVSDLDSIYDLDVNVFVPNALGRILNENTIDRLKVDLVCGAANNQLATPEDAERLRKKGIMYAPDFVVNRMGIVNCADEYVGPLSSDDTHIAKHYDKSYEHSIPNALERIKAISEKRDIDMNAAAIELADEQIEAKHPIWGDRFNETVEKCV